MVPHQADKKMEVAIPPYLKTNMTVEVDIPLVITSTEAELETPPPRGTEPTTTALKLGIKSGAWKLATTPCK